MKPGRQLALIWGAVAIVLIAMAPLASTLASALPACPVREWTGIPCPGCGSGRASLLLARFEFVEAIRRFPLATLGWSLLVGGGLVAGAAGLRGHGVPRLAERWTPALRWSLIAAIALNWTYLVDLLGLDVVDYVEPKDKEAGNQFTRVLDKGTFAFQAHDPKSKVLFKNIRVRRLP